MNTIKNAHSPAGMGYIASGAYWKNLTDCPTCKYGTIDIRHDKDDKPFARCADCGAVFTIEDLKARKILRSNQ